MVDGISIVVCTYNGGNRLREVLSSIEQQEFAGNLELILVDNNSSNETVQIINDEINKMTVSARSVIEKQQGLQFARVKGFYEAKYDVVLMVDDDNFLSKNYVSEVFTAFQKDDTLGLVGGLGIARFEAEKPWWFDDYQINFAVGAQSNTLYGAGLGVRKKVYLSVLENPKIKPAITDRTGESLMSGGDTEMNFWFTLSGWGVKVLKHISFEHFMPKNRMTIEYLHRLHHGFGMTRVLTIVYQDYLANGYKTLPRPSIVRPMHRKRLSYLESVLEGLMQEGNHVEERDLESLRKSLSRSALHGEIEMIQNLNWSYRKKLVTIQQNCLALSNAS